MCKAFHGAVWKNKIFDNFIAQNYPKSTKSESLVVGPPA